MRRSVVVLAIVVALLAITAAPVLAYNWIVRETGFTECSLDDDARTRIYAKYHHRHLRKWVAYSYAYFPDNGIYYASYKNWQVLLMSWELSNIVGRAFSTSGSYGYCA